MEVYIEDVIVDNFIIDYLILSLTNFSLKQKTPKFKIILSSMIGVAMTILLSKIVLPPIVTIVVKMLTGILMCIVVLQKFSFKNLFLFFMVFLTFTFVLGGFCSFIISLLQRGGKGINLPTGLVLLIVVLYCYVLMNVVKVFYKKQKISKYIYKTQIKHRGKNIKIEAYLDSGNILVDKQTNLPVVIINYKTFNKLLPEIDFEKFMFSKIDCNFGRYIDFDTVSGKGKMFVFQVDEICIDFEGKETKISALLGISSSCFNKNAGFEALLNPLAM